jgi:hypothetical protein
LAPRAGEERGTSQSFLLSSRAGNATSTVVPSAVWRGCSLKRRYPDAGYPDHLTGVELLSYEHHASLPAFAHDLDRNLEFLEEEWFLIPITDLHVRNEPDRLVDLIAKVLGRREVRNVHRTQSG